MPKLYEYLGISIFFYAGEHLPVHVHGRHGSEETKAEIITANGRVVAVRSQAALGNTSLSWSKLKQKRSYKSGRMFSF